VGRPRKKDIVVAAEPVEDPAADGLRLITPEDVEAAAPLLQETYRKQVADAILLALKKGHFVETAVQGAGVTTDAYYAAMRIARQPKCPKGVSDLQWQFLRKLHVEIEQADALGEMKLVDQILTSNSSSSILDYMSRRWPRRFKQQEKGTVVNVLNQTKVNVSAMSREQVIEEMAKMGVKPIKAGDK